MPDVENTMGMVSNTQYMYNETLKTPTVLKLTAVDRKSTLIKLSPKSKRTTENDEHTYPLSTRNHSLNLDIA